MLGRGMEAMKPPESSPWPRRVIIAGFSFSLLGFIILFSNGSSIDAMMNPETSHIVKSTGESSEVIELEAYPESDVNDAIKYCPVDCIFWQK